MPKSTKFPNCQLSDDGEGEFCARGSVLSAYRTMPHRLPLGEEVAAEESQRAHAPPALFWVNFPRHFHYDAPCKEGFSEDPIFTLFVGPAQYGML